MALPRSGKSFFESMGQSFASKCLPRKHAFSIGLLDVEMPHWAIDAFFHGYDGQRRSEPHWKTPVFDPRPYLNEIPAPPPPVVLPIERPAKFDEVLKLRAAGISVSGCAKELGIAESTIRGWIKKYGEQ